MSSQRLKFSVLAALWNDAVEEPVQMPIVSGESDLASYLEACASAITKRVELLREQTQLFDLAGIEYVSLARRFIPNRFGFEPQVFLAGTQELTGDPEIRRAYRDKTFPFLEILHKRWFHVLFLADDREPKEEMAKDDMKHIVALRSPFHDIGVAAASATVAPEELTQILRERLEEIHLLGDHQRKYYGQYDLSEGLLKDVISRSSSITLNLLRKAALKQRSYSQRSILFVPAYIREGERIGGIVFMGENALSEEECNGLEIATKMVLSTFRLIEEAATQHNILLERERDELRSFLLTRMRHDIRHPFFESLTFLERLRDKTGILTTTVQAIKDLDSQTSALGQSLRGVMGMIDQTLFSLETGMFGDVPIHKVEDSVNDFLDDFHWLFRESMPAGRVLEIRHLPENTTFAYDPAIVREVLTNLVKNAIAYAQGDVVVAVRRIDDTHLVISVADGGPGLPENIKSRLGTPLLLSAARSDPMQSMGRGLSICYRLMEIHGTHLAYDASYTTGTRFNVTIGPPEDKKEP
jgi:signal transduction histidine kinase